MVRQCEQVQTNENDKPIIPVEIFDSGTLPLKKPYLVALSDATTELDDTTLGTIAEYHDDDLHDDEENAVNGATEKTENDEL